LDQDPRQALQRRNAATLSHSTMRCSVSDFHFRSFGFLFTTAVVRSSAVTVSIV
jgi:hypothetical protein